MEKLLFQHFGLELNVCSISLQLLENFLLVSVNITGPSMQRQRSIYNSIKTRRILITRTRLSL